LQDDDEVDEADDTQQSAIDNYTGVSIKADHHLIYVQMSLMM